MNFYPRCITHEAQETLSNSGHILPCCWMDNEFDKKDHLIGQLYSDHLHIDNISSREELLQSAEWVELFNAIITKQNLPKCCIRECSTQHQWCSRRDSYFGEEADNIIARQ